MYDKGNRNPTKTQEPQPSFSLFNTCHGSHNRRFDLLKSDGWGSPVHVPFMRNSILYMSFMRNSISREPQPLFSLFANLYHSLGNLIY